MSTPAVSPKCRSARSFSVSDGMLTLTPGRLMPFVIADRAAVDDSVRTLAPSVESARSSMEPSASRIRSPGCTSFAKRRVSCGCALAGAQHRFGSDGEDDAGLKCGAPVFEAAEANLGTLQIQQNADVQRAPARAALRTASMRAACSSCAPCEALRRNTSTPAANSWRKDSRAHRWPAPEWLQFLYWASSRTILTDGAGSSRGGLAWGGRSVV